MASSLGCNTSRTEQLSTVLNALEAEVDICSKQVFTLEEPGTCKRFLEEDIENIEAKLEHQKAALKDLMILNKQLKDKIGSSSKHQMASAVAAPSYEIDRAFKEFFLEFLLENFPPKVKNKDKKAESKHNFWEKVLEKPNESIPLNAGCENYADLLISNGLACLDETGKHRSIRLISSSEP